MTVGVAYWDFTSISPTTISNNNINFKHPLRFTTQPKGVRPSLIGSLTYGTHGASGCDLFILEQTMPDFAQCAHVATNYQWQVFSAHGALGRHLSSHSVFGWGTWRGRPWFIQQWTSNAQLCPVRTRLNELPVAGLLRQRASGRHLSFSKWDTDNYHVMWCFLTVLESGGCFCYKRSFKNNHLMRNMTDNNHITW